MHYNKALHQFALFTAFSSFCLIVAGGLVTSTQSGLSVPDWPLSYGQVMPPMVGGIFYEHSHRMVATFVGLLMTVLAIWLWRKDQRRWMRVLGLVALGAVITQGVLGGLTVILMLPTPVSVSHATLAQMFFSLTVAIALFTSPWWRGESATLADTHHPSILLLAALTTFAVYLQLILGALMRHTQSGLAVPDFPLAYGQLFPSLSPESVASYNEQLIRDDVRLASDGLMTTTHIIIHMLHRMWALVVGGLVVWTAVRLRMLSRASPRFSGLSYILLCLLVIQVTLGALTVLSLKSVEITTAHVATGALLLAMCVLAVLHAVKIFGWQWNRVSPVLTPQEAGT